MNRDTRFLWILVLVLVGASLIFMGMHFWTERANERVETLSGELRALETELEELWEENRRLEEKIEEKIGSVTVYEPGEWDIEVIKDIQNEVLYWHYGEPTERDARHKAWEIFLCGSEHGVDPLLIAAMGIVESNLTHDVRPSSAGAIGIMQLMPATARAFEADPLDRFENIWTGTKFFRELLDFYEGDLEKALSHYNSGRSDQAYGETRRYVQKVLTTYESLRE